VQVSVPRGIQEHRNDDFAFPRTIASIAPSAWVSTCGAMNDTE
jgi:hypothetical protein